jgi:di/tricarboxylate transporter
VTASVDLWARHLQPGEILVWSASTSSDLLRATRRRRIAVALISGTAAAVLAVFLGLRFIESVGGYATANIGASIVTPIFGAFSLAMAVLAYGSFRRLARRGRLCRR